MTTTAAVLATICSAAIILNAVARLPRAIARLARACIPAVTAVRELRAAISERGSGCACGLGAGSGDRLTDRGRDILRPCGIGVTVQCAIEFGRADTMQFGQALSAGPSAGAGRRGRAGRRGAGGQRTVPTARRRCPTCRLT